MNEPHQSENTENTVEAVLRGELLHGDHALETVSPVLGHLLADGDNSMFSDEIVARVRGMMHHLAVQLLRTHAELLQVSDADIFAREHAAPFADQLSRTPALLDHAHALALEWQLTQRLEQKNAIDPVLSPLMQSLIAADEPAAAARAMDLLAAQARFGQTQRRMELPLTELPGDLLHQTLATFRSLLGDAADEIGATERAIRGTIDEGKSRIGLVSRILTEMGAGARGALNLQHAGVALFLGALGNLSGQTRTIAILSTNERQLARLALALRAAGLRPKEVEEQFLYLHPDIALPEGFEHLRADQAASLLAASPMASAS